MGIRRVLPCGAALGMILLAAGPGLGDEASASVNARIQEQLGVFVYPKGDQNEAAQATDSLGCYDSAKERTGIDPEAPAAEPETPEKTRGGAVRGAAGGAAVGAAMGAIFDEAGKGAAAGALGGALRGHHGRKQAKAQARKAAVERAEAANRERMETFSRAFGACMDARNYSVE